MYFDCTDCWRPLKNSLAGKNFVAFGRKFFSSQLVAEISSENFSAMAQKFTGQRNPLPLSLSLSHPHSLSSSPSSKWGIVIVRFPTYLLGTQGGALRASLPLSHSPLKNQEFLSSSPAQSFISNFSDTIPRQTFELWTDLHDLTELRLGLTDPPPTLSPCGLRCVKKPAAVQHRHHGLNELDRDPWTRFTH